MKSNQDGIKVDAVFSLIGWRKSCEQNHIWLCFNVIINDIRIIE